MRSYGGLGLGLAISKSLVEAHGGTISAASAGHGTGSTFLITLPKAFRPAPVEPATASTEDVERCLNAGFNKHVTKPVTFEVLQQIIAEVCDNKNDGKNKP
jgi:CheY-like chemotaxis protein